MAFRFDFFVLILNFILFFSPFFPSSYLSITGRESRGEGGIAAPNTGGKYVSPKECHVDLCKDRSNDLSNLLVYA